MIRIIFDNMIIVITNTCPRNFAICAVNSFDRRGPKRVKTEYADDFGYSIPRFSPFVGQLGRMRP